MRDQIQGSNKMPHPFSKTRAIKFIRFGLGWAPYNNQRRCHAKASKAVLWFSQVINQDHSIAPIVWSQITRSFGDGSCFPDSYLRTFHVSWVKPKLTKPLAQPAHSEGWLTSICPSPLGFVDVQPASCSASRKADTRGFLLVITGLAKSTSYHPGESDLTGGGSRGVVSRKSSDSP